MLGGVPDTSSVAASGRINLIDMQRGARRRRRRRRLTEASDHSQNARDDNHHTGPYQAQQRSLSSLSGTSGAKVPSLTAPETTPCRRPCPSHPRDRDDGGGDAMAEVSAEAGFEGERDVPWPESRPRHAGGAAESVSARRSNWCRIALAVYTRCWCCSPSDAVAVSTVCPWHGCVAPFSACTFARRPHVRLHVSQRPCLVCSMGARGEASCKATHLADAPSTHIAEARMFLRATLGAPRRMSS